MIQISEKTIDVVKPLVGHYKNKTILVTGASGMIGQNVTSLLLAMNDRLGAGMKIIIHGRDYNKVDELYGNLKDREDVLIVISDIKTIDVVQHIDYIIHTAGVTGGSKQHLDFPMRTISTALEGTKRILDIAKYDDAATVFLSSLEVYGNTGMNASDINENDGGYVDCTSPRSSYPESKRMCECMYSAYAKQYGVRAFSARLTATFGYGVSLSDKRVFAQFAKSISEKNDIVLKSTGETVRDYCDAEDAATAFLFIMANGKPGEAYNVANMETTISIKDMAQRFIDLNPEAGARLTFDLSEDATKLGYNGIMRNVVNSQKLMDIGWKPIFGLDDMINKLMTTYKQKKTMDKKYKRGFTVGTFDMFHRGHLNLFRQAKEYCDYLIVGIHSDEWVMHCKNRPTIIPYEDRADIVASIKYVDEVVKNETRSKMEAWEKLHFDVAFIGDDWKGTDVWNKIEAELKAVGCDTIYIPYTNGISTTQLREKIKNTSTNKEENK